jgi:hypothetical protein
MVGELACSPEPLHQKTIRPSFSGPLGLQQVCLPRSQCSFCSFNGQEQFSCEESPGEIRSYFFYPEVFTRKQAALRELWERETTLTSLHLDQALPPSLLL